MASRIMSRCELGDRPLVHRARHHTPERRVHSGTMYQSGVPHTGGKSHLFTPQDHPDLVAPARAGDAASTFLAPIYGASATFSRHIQLPCTKPGATPRSSCGRESDPPRATTPSGRRFIGAPDHGDVVAHSYGAALSSPRPAGRATVHAGPRDNVLVGFSTTDKNDRPGSPAGERARGRLRLDQPPPFVPDPWVPPHYRPQLRKVAGVARDNGIFPPPLEDGAGGGEPRTPRTPRTPTSAAEARDAVGGVSNASQATTAGYGTGGVAGGSQPSQVSQPVVRYLRQEAPIRSGRAMVQPATGGRFNIITGERY